MHEDMQYNPISKVKVKVMITSNLEIRPFSKAISPPPFTMGAGN